MDDSKSPISAQALQGVLQGVATDEGGLMVPSQSLCAHRLIIKAAP